MAFRYGWRGPNIVKDGLVLYLDASSPTSYSQLIAPTTWKDISGNGYNGTLTNGPTFNSDNGGAIVFDGVDDYITATISCNKTTYSVDWWIYPLTTTNFNQTIYFNSGWGAFLCHTTSTGGVYVGTTAVDGSGRIAPWRTGVFVTNTWQNFTWTFNNGAAVFYKNGAVEASATIAVSVDSSFTSLGIGVNTSNTINGRVANLKIYSNKALSASEVLQNYNATRTRFGL